MCLGSLVIALTPGYVAVGGLAGVILLLARILQGLSVGGEYGASATYLSEVGGKAGRGFWSSFHYVTLILGQLTALGLLIVLQRTLSHEALAAWGWRIAFFVGAGLAVVVFWIRLGLPETRAFETARVRGEARASTRLLFLDHPRETAIIFGLTAAGSLSFYAYTTYMQKYLVNTAHFTADAATAITAAALVCFVAAQPAAGWLSDRVGRRRMLVVAFGIGAALAYPVFALIANANSWTLAFAVLLSALLAQSGYTSIAAVVKAELFPTHVRALSVALPYALANAVFGGTAEYVALRLKQAGVEPLFWVYVGLASAVACVIALRMRDTRDESAILED
jgi:MHS family alpha-ketoglutarate permease-like MFS transporter